MVKASEVLTQEEVEKVKELCKMFHCDLKDVRIIDKIITEPFGIKI